MKKFLKTLFARYDVPANHTWSKTSMTKQKGVQQVAATNAEIDRVIKDASVFLSSKR